MNGEQKQRFSQTWQSARLSGASCSNNTRVITTIRGFFTNLILKIWLGFSQCAKPNLFLSVLRNIADAKEIKLPYLCLAPRHLHLHLPPRHLRLCLCYRYLQLDCFELLSRSHAQLQNLDTLLLYPRHS